MFCRKEGNPFNTTALPSPPVSPPASSPSLPLSSPPSSSPSLPPSHAHGPSAHISRKVSSTKRITWVAIGGTFILLAVAVGIFICCSKSCKRKQVINGTAKTHGMAETIGQIPRSSEHLLHLSNQLGKGKFDIIDFLFYRCDALFHFHNYHLILFGKTMSQFFISVPREAVVKPQDGYVIDCDLSGLATKPQAGKDECLKGHVIDTTLPPPPRPPSLLPIEKSIVKPIEAAEISCTRNSNPKYASSLRSFTIASLQQITNSFSQENFIGSGMLGSVYRAELPNGKVNWLVFLLIFMRM